MNDIQRLFDFIENSVSPAHGVTHAADVLEKAGFTALDLKKTGSLKPEALITAARLPANFLLSASAAIWIYLKVHILQARILTGHASASSQMPS